MRSIIVVLLALMILPAFSGPADAAKNIVNTAHDLSSSKIPRVPGEPQALTETRICIFCHTPHNATPRTPLWNKAIKPVNYVLYSSTTLAARPSQPNGPSRLCLSCHDGTIALGAVLNPAGGISTTGEIRQQYLIGTVLSGDHPISFSYYDSLPNFELNPSPPQNLLLYGNANMECSTCHDAHDNSLGSFLRESNRDSQICTECHTMNGWDQSIHKSSPNTWNGAPPDPWPRTGINSQQRFVTVAENGCESCHNPHAAGGPQRLLNYLQEEQNCYPCHNGNVALKNVQVEFQKISRHPVERTTIGVTSAHHEPKELPNTITGHVECVDCHNPHAVNSRTAQAPYVTGSLDQVSGIDSNGSPIMPPVGAATYEYEVCFKCHGFLTSRSPFIPRVINENNKINEFSVLNPSYHPVVGIGKNLNMPSLPSALAPTMTSASIIRCTDCHDDDDSSAIGFSGPKGPHGSMYRPILRERYDTIDNTLEGPDVYALCYRCHSRDSILSDASFNRHRLHIVDQRTPCSVCHDPHGIPDDGTTGSHLHLINFDTRIVTPAPGCTVPFYNSNQITCTLVCHNHSHINDVCVQGVTPHNVRQLRPGLRMPIKR